MIHTTDNYKHEQFPHIPEALVAALDKAFPLTSPTLSDTERAIFVRVGQRQVIEFLREQFRQQQDDWNALEANVLGGR
jgi:hypothetical protein